MAGKKKTNFISYELKKLDTYMEQLQDYLDNNPPNLATDRIERISTPRGGESIRVIASKEDQVKAFMGVLEKLPKVLEDINRLRKEVDTDKKETELRGGAEMPGFMMSGDDSDNDDEPKEKPKKKSTNKKGEDDDDSEKFDDDSFFEDDGTGTGTMKLLPPPDDNDLGDDDWQDED